MKNEFQILKDIVERRFAVSNINKKTRKGEVVIARQAAHSIAKEHYDKKASLSKIGKFFGGKDHATVLHSCKSVKNMLETNKRFKLDYFMCRNEFIKKVQIFENIYFNNVEQKHSIFKEMIVLTSAIEFFKILLFENNNKINNPLIANAMPEEAIRLMKQNKNIEEKMVDLIFRYKTHVSTLTVL